MPEIIVVYQTNPDNVQRTLQVLERRNLHPVLLDEPEKTSRYRPRDLLVRIGVPESECETAAQVLVEAERESRARLAPVMKTVRTGFILMVTAAVLVVIMGLIDPGGKWFAITLIALGVVVIALLLRAIRSRNP